jgi:O-antigen/teichoic acid export membrane protein
LNTKKILGFAVGPIAAAGLSLISVPAIAWAFTPEDVGRLNIVYIIVSFSVLLFALGLDQAYVREYHEVPDHGELLKSCYSPGMILIAVAAVPVLAMSDQLSYLFFGTHDPTFLWITSVCVLASFISRFLSLILRMQERAIAFSMSQLIPKIVFLLVIGLIMLAGFPRQFLQLLLAFSASSAAVLLVYAWNTRKDWKPALGASIDKTQLRPRLGYSLPLVFASLAYWGLTATSSVALRSLSSFRELGIYSVSMSVAGVAVIVQSIFSVIWAPVVYKWAAKGEDMSRVDQVARQALAMVIGVFVMCGMFSWLIDYVLPSQYAEVKYLVLCSIVQPLLYTLSEVTSVGIAITRRTMLSFWSTVAALVVNLGLNLLLVPQFGASGAVVANAIAYLVFFVARTESAAFVWRHFPRAKLYLFTTGAIALSVLTVIFGPTLGWLCNAVWVAILPLVIWAFREECREALHFLQQGISRRRSRSAQRT